MQKHKHSKNRDEQSSHREPIIPTIIKAPVQYVFQSRNTGNATFSNIAKQAESLSNGDNSLIFNNYNNNIVFRSNRIDLNDCVSIDVINRQLKNINEIKFHDKSTLKGICDGYTTNNQGGKVPIYDEKIALSTVFGYGLTQQIDTIRKDLSVEIERRKYEDQLLRETCNDLQAQIDSLETRVIDLEAAKVEVENRIQALERISVSLTNRVSAVESFNISLNNSLAELQFAHNELLTRVMTLETDNAALKSLTKHFVSVI